MNDKELERAVEAILFASGDSILAQRIALVLGVEEGAVLDAAARLTDYYSFERRGIRLVRLENSLQLCSAPEHAAHISRALETRKPPKLSAPALEVLAIAAYFQPVTRAYIDSVRGVDSSYTVSTLAERGLIEPCGRLEVPGRPTLYKTSEAFLRVMGISSLDELPELPNPESDGSMEKLQGAIDELAMKTREEQLRIEE